MKLDKKIPDALILINFLDKYLKFISMDNEGIIFETAEVIDESIVNLDIYIFNFDNYRYDTYHIYNCQIVQNKCMLFSYFYKVEIERNDYTKIEKLIDNISHSLHEIRNQVSESYSNKEFHENYTEQEKEWYKIKRPSENMDCKFIDKDFELAFCINNFDKYDMFIEKGIYNSIYEILEIKGIKSRAIFQGKFNRIYIGNEFCPINFPKKEQLIKILELSVYESFEVTVCLSYIREEKLSEVTELLQYLNEWSKINDKKVEIVVNDWGVLSVLSKKNFNITPIIGRLLNKRRKDSIHRGDLYNVDIKEYYSENNYNANHFIDFLSNFNVHRFEFESCYQDIKIPKGNHSLHFPFYQLNTSQYCTLYSTCTTFNRSNQTLVKSCSKFCREICFMYPKDFNTIGYGNSIFGFDKTIFDSIEKVNEYISKGINRFVYDDIT